MEIINKIKKHTLSFYAINIFIVFLCLFPKSISTLGDIPIRLCVTVSLLLIIWYEIFFKKISINKKFNVKYYVLPILFLFSLIPSIFISYDKITSIYTLIKYLSYFILFVTIIQLNFNKKEYKVMLLTFISSSCLLLFGGIIQYIFEINLFTQGLEFYPGSKGRIDVGFFNACYFGLFLTILLPFVANLLINSEKPKSKSLYTIIILLIFTNIIFAFTRSSFLVLFGVSGLILIFFNKLILKKENIICITLLLIGLAINITFIPGGIEFAKKTKEDFILMVQKTVVLPSFFEDKEGNSIDKEDFEYIDYSLQDREIFAEMAQEIGADYVWGVGFGSYVSFMESEEFSTKYPDYNNKKIQPHNSLLLIYAECGIISAILIIAILIIIITSILYKMKKVYSKNKILYCQLATALISFIAYIVVSILSENSFYDTQTAYMMTMILSLTISYYYSNINVIK